MSYVDKSCQEGNTHIPSSSTDHTTRGALSPQPPEADKVLDDRDGPEGTGADTEDGIMGQAGPVPQAEVQGDGHAHAVQDDEGPEDGDALLPRAEGVVEGRWVLEVGVCEADLGLGEDGA